MSKIFFSALLPRIMTPYTLYKKVQYIVLVFFFATFLVPQIADAARLIVSPTTGTFEVGSTFSVQIFLDTEGESINAFDIKLNFPPNKMQLVSPSIGKSIVEIWTGPPQYNNRTGTIRLQGGIPNGITASRGLITELTFRVRQVGSAVVIFSDVSQVLKNDGKGTPALNNTTGGVYQFVLPPPAGPIVASETHPDQSLWYSRSDVILQWGNGDATVSAYSYMLSKDPTDIPDDISDGKKTSVTYTQIPDGTHYFHIKSLREGVWGGDTHFAVNVDTEPPAEFSVIISPSQRTTSKNPIVLFETTDKQSGVDHYEMKTIPLYPTDDFESFFIEANTRQILDLSLGKYDIVVRAYDHAGNVRVVTQKVSVVEPVFQIVRGRGLQIGNLFTIPWSIGFSTIVVIIISLILLGIRTRRRHHMMRDQYGKPVVKGRLKDKFEELKKYRNKYTKVIFFFMLLPSLLLGPDTVAAQPHQNLPPPIISTISMDISNEDIFYAGGRTANPGGEVILYLQSLQSGEVFSLSVPIGENNEWFYRHDSFLASGDYILWAQQQLGEEISAPSPQMNLHIRTTAIQFGSSRLSLEVVYLLLSILFLLVIVSLVGHITFHAYQGRKWRRRLTKEVHEAEEALRHGFMILRRDVYAELAIVQKAKLKGVLAQEEQKQEKQLLYDLEQIEKNIGKEILDIERLELKE